MGYVYLFDRVSKFFNEVIFLFAILDERSFFIGIYSLNIEMLTVIGCNLKITFNQDEYGNCQTLLRTVKER